MLWFEDLVRKLELSVPQTINDSKTPSGRVHVGALRGVLIHDAVFRQLIDRDASVRYLFGSDDYDPLDELPAGRGEFFEQYLGQPLCNVPAPPESSCTDMADHYISEFFGIFDELGVRAERYRMRDTYRSGIFNETIEAILNNAATVRRVYLEVSHSRRPETWYPFQAICEQCGRIGTTEVHHYENGEVVYTCRHDLVKWATGCGYRGRVSPFDGRGKLPWKLEWVAKWRNFPVTIEGAGKDHTTRGGARDVSAACLREIFGEQPPVNIPYEFFLVGGAKMSSSRGIGVSAREMADFLPPEVLRFLILRTQPNRPVNFSLDEEYIVKLFNEFDRLHLRVFEDASVKPDEKQVYFVSEVKPEGAYYDANFQLILALAQMPHLDLEKEFEKRKGSPLTDVELRHLHRRIDAARTWLDRYASDEEKFSLQTSLPEGAAALGPLERGFLHILADNLGAAVWEDAALQTKIFDVARLTPIEVAAAFKAIYRVLLDRASGPKAGSLLAFLDPAFVIERLQAVPYSQEEFWLASALSGENFETWLREDCQHIVTVQAQAHFMDAPHLKGVGGSLGIIELLIQRDDGRRYGKRVHVEGEPSSGLSSNERRELFQARTREMISRWSGICPAFDSPVPGD